MRIECEARRFDGGSRITSVPGAEEDKMADVVINPDTSGLFWLDLHRAAEFSLRGEKETRLHLQQIRELM